MAVHGTIIDTILEDANAYTIGAHKRVSHILLLDPYRPNVFVHCYKTISGLFDVNGISTTNIAGDGTVNNIIDTSSIFYARDGDTAFAKIRDNVFALLYRSSGSPEPGNMDLATIVINDDGTHGAINYRGVSVGDNHYPALCGTSDGYAITAYYYNSRIYIKTWKIEADGSIAAAATDTTWINLGGFKFVNSVTHVRGNIYLVSYTSFATGVNVYTLTSFSVISGAITILDTADFGAIIGEVVSSTASTKSLSSPEGRCLIAYTGSPLNRGRVVTLDIDAVGNIGAMIDKYTVHGATNCYDFHIHEITPSYPSVSYFNDTDNYGYIDVVNINAAGIMSAEEWITFELSNALDFWLTRLGYFVIGTIRKGADVGAWIVTMDTPSGPYPPPSLIPVVNTLEATGVV